ncbi:MAG: extracellular solute-binding protein [Patescibacteria group bacterium]|nr:extracellular solute-binding protein [Patescibacteria group bacterium]
MKTKTKIISILLISALIPFIWGCGLRKKPAAQVEPLEMWGVWDDSDVIQNFISQYKEQNEHIKDIKYRKFTYDEYENELIKALAAGRGPDIFQVHHSWLARYQDLMLSLEQAQEIYNQAASEKSGCDKPPLIEEPLLTERQYKEAFVDVAHDDFVKNQQIYGIPLTIDTLALFYNQDLFSGAGIPLPPGTWEDFEKDVRLLTQKDQYNTITQSGAAIGAASNVNRAGDILALMMMQLGCPMTDPENFSSQITQRTTRPEDSGQSQLYTPAQQALDFYSSFANGQNPNYTWNSSLHNSVDSFQEGRVAMLLNYTYAYSTIKSKAPKLNFKITPAPQFQGATSQNKIAYANYWGYAVSKKSAQIKNKPVEAWKFLLFLGAKEQVQGYADKTQRPASRRDVLAEQKKQPDMGVFADQALIAKSWYQPNEGQIDQIFNQNIQAVYLGQKTTEQAIQEINAKIDILMQENEAKNKELETE